MRSSLVAVAALALVAQVGQIAHLAFVQHAICLEHGEAIHTRPAAPGAAQFAPPESNLPSVDRATTPAFADEHEHCAVCATYRRRALEGPTLALDPGDLSISAPAVPERIFTPSSGEALYRRAPKSSPPA